VSYIATSHPLRGVGDSAGAGGLGKALLVIGLGLGVLYLGSKAMRSPLASNRRRRGKRRLKHNATPPTKRYRIQDQEEGGGWYTVAEEANLGDAIEWAEDMSCDRIINKTGRVVWRRGEGYPDD
jgi:hypothetical protein